MKIAILGYAGQGKSAYEYWNTPENQITICDQATDLELPPGVASQIGENYLQNLDQFDLLIRTPALHPDDIQAANPDSPDILDKVTTVTNEFMKVCPTRNIIGVTGTKGKGTTSTLITKILESAGYRVHLGGNIGIPPLEMLKNDIKPEDWVVLELANFQLVDINYSPHIGVCLMIEPEHLNWHGDMDKYVSVKQRMFAHQTEEDIAIYYGPNPYSKHAATISLGTHIPFMEAPGCIVADGKVQINNVDICPVEDIKLLGEHNWQNICAAVTACWQITQDTTAMRNAIAAFSGLPHRLELVREVDGIKYYNDSFASALAATGAALGALPANKILIMGGFDRGIDLDDLIGVIQAHAKDIRKILVIGDAKDRIVKAFKAAQFDNFQVSDAKDMETIVAEARALAQPGDIVLLSPGFPSFDMFKNFEERGTAFKSVVNGLT